MKKKVGMGLLFRCFNIFVDSIHLVLLYKSMKAIALIQTFYYIPFCNIYKIISQISAEVYPQDRFNKINKTLVDLKVYFLKLNLLPILFLFG